jgi:hypothetical protein
VPRLPVVIGIAAASFGAGAPSSAVAAGETSALVAVEPCRLLDTRDSVEPLTAGETVEVRVAGRCDVPEHATAASLTLTAIAPPAGGWLSAYPSGSSWPGTSTLNVAPDEVRANTTVVGLGTDGAVTVLVDAGGHLLVDVSAAFVPVAASSSGRFVPITRQRLVDTRPEGRPDAGAVIAVPLPAGVPSDAVALAVNVTTSDSNGPGYFATWPHGAARPEASILNTDAAGQTRAAAAIVPVSAGGFGVFTSAGDHVIVDVAGYFTGPSAPESDTGLFRSVTPIRVVDSRADGQRLYRDGAREWPVTAAAGGQGAAVLANVTMADVRSAGWVLAHGSRTTRPAVSSVNAGAGETVANQAIIGLSTTGLAVHSTSSSHVIIDVTGWFIGEPATPTEPPPTNARAAPGRTLVVGDSIPAALNTVDEALVEFGALDHVLEAVECRRTVAPSCRYRGAPLPPSALEVIETTPGPFDTLVMITGYNDSNSTFAAAIDRIVSSAHARGIDRVVWLTFREDRTNLVLNNGHLVAALQRHPDLRLVDWNAHAAGQQTWFAADNVHVSPAGAIALARFVAEQAAQLD